MPPVLQVRHGTHALAARLNGCVKSARRLTRKNRHSELKSRLTASPANAKYILVTKVDSRCAVHGIYLVSFC